MLSCAFSRSPLVACHCCRHAVRHSIGQRSLKRRSIVSCSYNRSLPALTLWHRNTLLLSTGKRRVSNAPSRAARSIAGVSRPTYVVVAARYSPSQCRLVRRAVVSCASSICPPAARLCRHHAVGHSIRQRRLKRRTIMGCAYTRSLLVARLCCPHAVHHNTRRRHPERPSILSCASSCSRPRHATAAAMPCVTASASAA